MPRDRSRSRSPRRDDDYERSRKRDRDRYHDKGYDSRDEKRSRRRSRSRDDHSRDDGREKRKRSRDRDETRRRSTSKSRSRSRSRERRREKDEKKRRKAERKAEKLREMDDEDARKVAELSVYSAVDNPFHDVNLNQQFKWHKKSEKEKKMGLTPVEAKRRDELRRQEAKEELERLNKRRAQREADQALREEEEARMQRMAESAQMAEWIAKDGEFQLEQERRRAGIRLKEKRAKAIDFLALNLKFASNEQDKNDDGLDLDEVGMEIDFDEPYAIFE
ncbi:hypothetical protein FRC03_001687, partial [Tulasnella sp. 419]